MHLKVQRKQWDPIGRVKECTLIDNLFCRRDDGRIKRPKHVIWLTSCKTTTDIQLL